MDFCLYERGIVVIVFIIFNIQNLLLKILDQL